METLQRAIQEDKRGRSSQNIFPNKTQNNTMNLYLFFFITICTLLISLTLSYLTLQSLPPQNIPFNLSIVAFYLFMALGLLWAFLSVFFIFFKIHIIDEFVSYPGRSNKNQMIIERYLRLTNYASSACWRLANKALYPDHDFRELPPDKIGRAHV